MKMSFVGRIKSLIPFRLGTVASPKHPAGKRVIFYRDRKGEHYPITVSTYCQSKQVPARDRPLALLVSPKYFRSFLASHSEIRDMSKRAGMQLFDTVTIAVAREDNSLPKALKVELFRDYQLAFVELLLLGAQELVWDPNGIYTLKLTAEEGSGTYVLQKVIQLAKVIDEEITDPG